MERLSAGLQAEINARPTQTILRSEDKELNQEFVKVAHVLPTRHIDIPSDFDGRKVWKGLLSPVMNQGQCGSCWAFASTSSLADRFNIQSMGIMHVQLSPTKLILCDWQGKELTVAHPEDSAFASADANILAFKNTACFGNSLIDACRYLFLIGTPTEACIPYDKKLGDTGQYQKIGEFDSVARLPLCAALAGPMGDMCADYSIDKDTGAETGTPERFYRALAFYAMAGEGEKKEYNIRDNIYKWGPLCTGMKVYPDFYTFDAKHEIYSWNGKGPQVGGHAIELVGWGSEDGQDYWIIKNSWGAQWGEGGYFRMARGVNMCEVEDNCLGLIPDFFYSSKEAAKLVHVPLDPKLMVERNKISNSIDISGGGINPTTGYTRRVMITMPWLNFTPPLEVADLPDWGHFVAGKDASPKNRVVYMATVRQQHSDMRYSKQSLEIYVVAVSAVLIAILVVLFLMWRRR